MSQSDDLQHARTALFSIPARASYEVPGKSDVLFELRDYSSDRDSGAEVARSEIPFLFKPFEVGQRPPPTKGRDLSLNREPTIHEYLDWTVTAASLDTLDFTGFRVLTLLPRYRPLWPPPKTEDDNSSRRLASLGAPLEAIPVLMPYGKAISATTIRCGRSYVEVPFFATKQSARGKGYGRALLYAIEDICRFLNLTKILLCSTDDATTIGTWQHLGFRYTLPHELQEWDIGPTELVHMTNTVQMVKMVGERPPWRTLRIEHDGFVQRLYFLPRRSEPAKKRKMEHHAATQNKSHRGDQDLKSSERPLMNGILELPVSEVKGDVEGTPESDRNNIIEQS